ncbi:MAG: glucose-6-phosphate dehydrogenase [Archangiaceae bacterium]|nr:glucose-6-phosphate dehydrogenase [Archangiaceae bacterium]
MNPNPSSPDAPAGAPQQLVIFGASGDLTQRKLIPALAALIEKGRPREGFNVVGVARREKTSEAWRNELREALEPDQRKGFDLLAPHVHYLPGDVGDSAFMDQLSQKLDGLPGGRETGRLFYLSIKPELFGAAAKNLGKAGLLQHREGAKRAWRRIIVEKPFGHDLRTARTLNHDLHEVLLEEQIFRIDHYLGKETVQNILGFRFHNAIFEPVWNREHVELIQVTVAEELGMENGRGGYYDGTGALRDMVQNHMLQVLSLICMEAPASLDADVVRGNKVAVLKALRPPDSDEMEKYTVRAQYAAGKVGGKKVPGYKEEEGVAKDSNTETFAAIRASIDNWRWAGVPIMLRHGKRLQKRFTEVVVQFRMPPQQLFNKPDKMTDEEFRRALRDGSLCQIRPNTMTLSIQPKEGISLSFGVKQPGTAMVMAPARWDFDYKSTFECRARRRTSGCCTTR